MRRRHQFSWLSVNGDTCTCGQPIYFVLLRVGGGGGTAHVWRSEAIMRKLVLFLYSVFSGDGTPAIRLKSKHPYQLKYLSSLADPSRLPGFGGKR